MEYLKTHGNAKTQTEISNEKEILQTAIINASSKNKYGNLDKQCLDNELNYNLGIDKYSSENIEDKIQVTFINTQRSYLIDLDGNIILKSPEILVNNVIIATDQNGQNIVENYSIDYGNSVYINFESTIQKGSITNISPALPYHTNGTEMSIDFTITGKSDGNEYSKILSVPLSDIYKTPSLSVGDYIEYDVTYTDIFTSNEYNSQNGWQLLSSSKNNIDSNLYDIEIISAGIPAGLNYDVNTINSFKTDKTASSPGTDGLWGGNSEQQSNYADTFYTSDSYSLCAASGLYYNFEKILFTGSSSTDSKKNNGYFTKINNQTPTSSTTGSIFRISSDISKKISTIRSITQGDITRTNNVESKSTNISDNPLFFCSYTASYYLASPYSGYTGALHYIYKEKLLGSVINDGAQGIRPVIKLDSVSLSYNYEKNLWNIN